MGSANISPALRPPDRQSVARGTDVRQSTKLPIQKLADSPANHTFARSPADESLRAEAVTRTARAGESDTLIDRSVTEFAMTRIASLTLILAK